MGKGSAPSAPDPYQSAQAQYQYGTQAAAYNAALNRVNTSGPTSSTNYQVTGNDPTTGAPIYQQTTTLSPQQQALLSGQQQQELGQQKFAEQARGNAEQAIANNPLPTTGQNQQFGADARNAAYNYSKSTLDPYWNEQQRALDSSLRNSGALPGSPAYNNAMDQFNTQRNDAYSKAENQAFGQGLSAQGQQIQQAQQLREIPLQEYQSLMGGTQVATPNPGSPAQAGTSAPDIMSAFNNQYQGQLAQYNAGVQSTNQDVGTLASLAAMYLMFA